MRRSNRLVKHNVWADFLHLVFPNKCLVCKKELSKLEDHICSFCDLGLTKTNFQYFEEPTDMDKLFWGRIQINNTYSHLFFEKTKASQDLLFSLKYEHNFPLGVYFGKRIGAIINSIPSFSDVDVFIPVPLHPKKQFIRGYNQSEALASGICEGVNGKIDLNSVTRIRPSETQTKKSRFDRWENVNEIFRVHNSIKKYNHIVLVDDVITTGSTIEAITRALIKENPDILVSVITLAIT